MTRNELVNHLTFNDCYPDEECDSDVAQLWHNGINGHICFVPCEDELSLFTWAHIIYELRIDPPLQYDSDYYVYQGWREGAYKQQQIDDKGKDK
jgi:hypothetical protein